MEPEVEQSVDEHMIKYKDRSIMWQHIKNEPIKWGFRMWYRCAPKTGYLYEFYIYTGRKETTESESAESVVLQLTEKLNESFFRIFFDNFFTLPSLLRKLTDNSLYGIGLFNKTVSCYQKLKNRQRRNLKQKKKQKKQQKPQELVYGSSFTSEESFNYGDCNCLVSKDELVALQWKDSKVVMLLTNCMDPSKLTSVERRQKGTSERLKVPCPAIIKEYNSHMNGVDIHYQLKTSYEIDRKSRFGY